MSNSKKIASVAFTGAAVAAATMMGAGPAFAAVSWHVKNSGISYPGVVRAKNQTGTTPSLKDTTTGQVLMCKNAFAVVQVSLANTPANPAVLGFLQKSFMQKTLTKWSSCSAAGLSFTAHLATSAGVQVSAYDPTRSGGLTSGKLIRKAPATVISGVISGTGINGCKASVSGRSVPIEYLNNRHSFFVNPARTVTLKVKNTNGACFGLFKTGDNAYFHGIYHVSFPANLTISRA